MTMPSHAVVLLKTAAAQHDDRDQHRAALKKHSTQDGAGRVPDVGGHEGFAGGEQLVPRSVAGCGCKLVTERDHGESGWRGEHQGSADEGERGGEQGIGVIASAQCREEAEKHQVVERHDGDGRKVEAQQAHHPVVLQQVEGLSGGCGLAAKHDHLHHRRQRVNDEK